MNGVDDDPLPAFDYQDLAMHGWVTGHTNDADADPLLAVESPDGLIYGLVFRPGASIRREGDHLIAENISFHGRRKPGPSEPDIAGVSDC